MQLHSKLLLSITLPLILGLIPSRSIVAADDRCKEVNLYNQPNSPLKTIPMYDQGPLNVCYAYTASQMMDYYLISNGKKSPNDPPINAHYIAFNHKTAKVFLRSSIQWKKKVLGESYMRWAINDLRRKGGVCKDEVVKKSIDTMKKEFDLSDNEFLFLFEHIWNRFDKKSANDWDAAEKRLNERGITDPDQQIEALIEAFEEIDRQRKRRGCPEGNCTGGDLPQANDPIPRTRIGSWLKAIKNIFQRVPNDKTDVDYLKYLRDSLFTECEKPENLIPIEVPAPKGSGGGWASDKKIARKINKALDDETNPQPVGIGYCSDIYSRPDEWKAMRQKKWRPRIAEIYPSGCNAHYSLLIGKKPSQEPGKCQYLIRNTMGDQTLWAKGWECECVNALGKTYSCKSTDELSKLPISRKVIGCWVEEDVLAPNTFDVEHF